MDSRTSFKAPPPLRWDEQRHACPGRAAYSDCADDSEGHTPGFGRNAHLGETERAVVAGDRSRHRVKQSDRCTDQR
jgi:hypothetical protein